MICDKCEDGRFPVGSLYMKGNDGTKICPDCDAVQKLDDLNKLVSPIIEKYKNNPIQKFGIMYGGNDPVNHPSHYKTGGIETIDFLEAKLGEGFEDYCVGNILKYLTRYKHKNGLEDLKKSKWYLEKVITWKEQNNDKTAR